MATAYEYSSDHIRSLAQITDNVNASQRPASSRAEIEKALEVFCNQGLAVTADDKYLSLALPANSNW